MQPELCDITLMNEKLISIIIPCYNQGRFLGEALESVLSQSYARIEIIVVDDGSTDNTREVAELYPTVRYIFQHNQGIARARNAGLDQSKGDYIVFLDSDDYLCAGALETNLAYIQEHPDCAFIAGHYQYVNTDSSVITHQRPHGVTHDHYLELLKRNYIGLPATVMYKREIVESIGGFNTSPSCYGCEDYELYLRIARRFPIFCHSQTVASYRRHGTGFSNKSAVMLQSALYVLELQWQYVQTIGSAYHTAYRRGKNTWRNLYGRELLLLVLRNMREGQWSDGYRNLRVLLPHILPSMVWQIRSALTNWHVLSKSS